MDLSAQWNKGLTSWCSSTQNSKKIFCFFLFNVVMSSSACNCQLLSLMCCHCCLHLTHSLPCSCLTFVTSPSAFLFSFPRQVLFLSSCLWLLHLWLLTVLPLLPVFSICDSLSFLIRHSRPSVVPGWMLGWWQLTYSKIYSSGGGGGLLIPSQDPALLWVCTVCPAAVSRTSWHFQAYRMCWDGIRGTLFSFRDKTLWKVLFLQARSSSATWSSNIKSKACSVTNGSHKRKLGTFLYTLIRLKYVCLPVCCLYNSVITELRNAEVNGYTSGSVSALLTSVLLPPQHKVPAKIEPTKIMKHHDEHFFYQDAHVVLLLYWNCYRRIYIVDGVKTFSAYHLLFLHVIKCVRENKR